MSKMSNLDLVLDEMITTGQKMIDAATALKEMFSETAPEMSKVETKTKKKEAPAQEAEQTEAPQENAAVTETPQATEAPAVTEAPAETAEAAEAPAETPAE